MRNKFLLKKDSIEFEDANGELTSLLEEVYDAITYSDDEELRELGYTYHTICNKYPNAGVGSCDAVEHFTEMVYLKARGELGLCPNLMRKWALSKCDLFEAAFYDLGFPRTKENE